MFLRKLDVIEPWRCESCKRLVYNLDPRGLPCEGAPIPMYINPEFQRVCSLCYEMHKAVDSADKSYWEKPSKRFYVLRPDPITEHC